MIDPDVLRPRIPRLGTITTGYGVETTSRRGNTYAQPTKAETLVLHTNDEAVARAALDRFGGEIREESPTWSYDVVTSTRTIELVALASGFRQALEHWRVAVCSRRCDGVRMNLSNGRPVDQPCACEEEIARGQERTCSPHTILPVLLDLDVERLGIFEIRSTSWGTAASLAGTMQALALAGVSTGSFPAILSMVDRTTRDVSGTVRDVVEMHLTVAARHDRLAELAGRSAASIAGADLAALPEGEDAERLDLMQTWTDLQTKAHGLGLRDRLREDWRTMIGGGRGFDEVTVDELRQWVEIVEATVADAISVIEAERVEALSSRLSPGGYAEGPVTPAAPPPDEEA